MGKPKVLPCKKNHKGFSGFLLFTHKLALDLIVSIFA